MTAPAIFCVHPDPEFNPDGSRYCQTCRATLTDAEGYDDCPTLDPFGPEPGCRHEWVVRWGGMGEVRRSAWHHSLDAATAQAEGLGIITFTEFKIRDGAVASLRIWSQVGWAWVPGEWARPAMAGAAVTSSPS